MPLADCEAESDQAVHDPSHGWPGDAFEGCQTPQCDRTTEHQHRQRAESCRSQPGLSIDASHGSQEMDGGRVEL